jgi:hypothetical protein
MEFGSLEEYFDWEQTQQQAVQDALADEQKAITWGQQFLRVWQEPSIIGPGQLVAIFGDIYSWQTLAQTEDEPALDALRRQQDRFLLARCYSLISPDGEVGSINRWDMWPITVNQFRLAEIAGWNPTHKDVWSWFLPKVKEMNAKRGLIPGAPHGGRR